MSSFQTEYKHPHRNNVPFILISLFNNRYLILNRRLTSTTLKWAAEVV